MRPIPVPSDVLAHNERALQEPFEILADTLCELFDMPRDEMVRHLNEKFAANPLTADFRLHLGSAQPR